MKACSYYHYIHSCYALGIKQNVDPATSLAKMKEAE